MKINKHKTVYLLLLIGSVLVLSCKNSKEKTELENIKKGEKLFATTGCITCHSLNNKKLYGPSLNHILGKKIKVIRNSREHSIIIDKAYIKKSISDPDYEKPQLFKRSTMPKPNLTEGEIDCITNYLISIQPKQQNK